MIELDKEQEALRHRIMDDRVFHDKLVVLVRDRAVYSGRHINQRFDAWRKAERQHLAYVDVDETDKAGNQIFTGAKDIIVPYTFAVLQTRLTYFFFSFVSKNPMVPIYGRGPNDFIAAKLMEVVQDYQVSEMKAALVLYCFLQDCERYGLGIIKNVFYNASEKRWVTKRDPVQFMGIKLFDRITRSREDVVTYEGNLPVNVSVFQFLPDPRVNVSDVKNMEFCGHKFVESHNSLLKKENNNEYFNVDKIPYNNTDTRTRPYDSAEKFSNDSDLSKIVGVSSAANELIGDPSVAMTKDSVNHDCVEMVIRLIPSEHELGKSKYPEEWIFTIAENSTVIKCEPSIYSEMNYYVGESNPDHASPFNKSTVDMTNGLSDTLSWLFNSHMANVRKIINDSVIVDPSIIELTDILKKSPVKIIRVKEAHWGEKGAIDAGIKQLQINDITRGHIQDSQVVMNLIQRVTAATDNIMGMTEEVKRTATETSSTINLATARLKLNSFLYFISAIKPWWKASVFNNQALLTEERYYKITDDMAKDLGYDPEEIKRRVLVKPEDLYGNFDFDIPPMDMPIDKANMAKIWREIIMDVVNNPMLQNRFDIMPMFKQMVYNLGITNMRDFEIKTKVMPDEKVQQLAKDGAIAPLDQAQNVSQQQMQEKMLEMLGNNGNKVQ